MRPDRRYRLDGPEALEARETPSTFTPGPARVIARPSATVQGKAELQFAAVTHPGHLHLSRGTGRSVGLGRVAFGGDVYWSSGRTQAALFLEGPRGRAYKLDVDRIDARTDQRGVDVTHASNVDVVLQYHRVSGTDDLVPETGRIVINVRQEWTGTTYRARFYRFTPS